MQYIPAVWRMKQSQMCTLHGGHLPCVGVGTSPTRCRRRLEFNLDAFDSTSRRQVPLFRRWYLRLGQGLLQSEATLVTWKTSVSGLKVLPENQRLGYCEVGKDCATSRKAERLKSHPTGAEGL